MDLMSVKKHKDCCSSLQMIVEDGCSQMDWLSLNGLDVGSAGVALRRWSVLIGEVHRYKSLLRRSTLLFPFLKTRTYYTLKK